MSVSEKFFSVYLDMLAAMQPHVPLNRKIHIEKFNTMLERERALARRNALLEVQDFYNNDDSAGSAKFEKWLEEELDPA